MVEFGLKLEDNKVSEWSEKYLNYEKLKAILKKAKAAQKNYEEQAKKRPEDADIILSAHKAGDLQFVTTTPSHSTVDLKLMGEKDETSEIPNERTSLIKGSWNSAPLQGSSSISSLTRKDSGPGPLSAITDYFGSRYERTLRGYLELRDRLAEDFEDMLHEEEEKTVSFYTTKIKELEHRLEILIENVAHSSTLAPTFVETDDQKASHKDGSVFQIPKIRRFAKVDASPKGRFQTVVNHVSKQIRKEKDILDALRKGDKELALKIELLPNDEDDELNLQNEKVVAEANSIKRALIDQYRTANLLKNFAIINLTGFVKIIKKHDKSIPEQKGRFKEMLEPHELFNEGKEVDILIQRYERYYANWFCEGDMREATAAMLPKKGDGLKLDSIASWISNGYVCSLGPVGMLGLHLGISFGRKYDNWWKSCVSSFPSMWRYFAFAVVLGCKCVYMDQI